MSDEHLNHTDKKTVPTRNILSNHELFKALHTCGLVSKDCLSNFDESKKKIITI